MRSLHSWLLSTWALKSLTSLRLSMHHWCRSMQKKQQDSPMRMSDLLFQFAWDQEWFSSTKQAPQKQQSSDPGQTRTLAIGPPWRHFQLILIQILTLRWYLAFIQPLGYWLETKGDAKQKSPHGTTMPTAMVTKVESSLGFLAEVSSAESGAHHLGSRTSVGSATLQIGRNASQKVRTSCT